VAQNIRQDSYGLVFGVNTFAALLFQTVLTMVVADDLVLALPPRQQFAVYAALWVLVGLLFLAIFMGEMVCIGGGCRRYVQRCQSEGLWRPGEEAEDAANDEEKRGIPLGCADQQ